MDNLLQLSYLEEVNSIWKTLANVWLYKTRKIAIFSNESNKSI